MIKIETQRLILRDYVFSDWQAVHLYAKQEDILIYEAWGPNNENDSKEFVRKMIEMQNHQPRESYELAITLKPDDILIGGCRFGFLDTDRHAGAIGYIINPDYWKNGYATEATMALIDYVSGISKIKRIKATCDVLNIASQKVLGKCGLKIVNKIENDFAMKGRFRDTYFFERKFEVPQESREIE